MTNEAGRIADWCGPCYQRVSSEAVAALLLVVMVSLLIWGVTMLLAPYRLPDGSMSSMHKGHWYPPRFVFWLGVFMLWDATTYGILVAAVFKARGVGTDAWVLIPFVGLAVSAIAAFALWAREKVTQESDPQ